MRGGWTSHFTWKTRPEETCLDIFGIAPHGSYAFSTTTPLHSAWGKSRWSQASSVLLVFPTVVPVTWPLPSNGALACAPMP